MGSKEVSREKFSSDYSYVFILIIFSFALFFIPEVMSESLNIRNIGQIGFNGTSDEYTSLNTVILDFNLDSTATNCTCNNYDGYDINNYTVNYKDWTYWKPCSRLKYWFLNPVLNNSDEIRLFVRCLVNHTNSSVNIINDSIMYNPRGMGLDVTPPLYFSINYLGDYISLSNISVLSINWDRSYDVESEYLKIPLVYSYAIKKNGLFIVNWTSVGTDNFVTIRLSEDLINNNETFSNADFIELLVRAENSGYLETISSKSLTVELNPPNVDYVISSDIDYTKWYSFNDVEFMFDELLFSWNATDDISGIYGYSILLTKNPIEEPSEILYGTVGHFSESKDYLLRYAKSVLNEGKNYFKVRARDNAGNWGDSKNFSINIDNNPPKTPILYSQGLELNLSLNNSNSSYTSNDVTRGLIFNWSVYDEGCGVVDHYVEISNAIDFRDLIYSGYTQSGEGYFNFSTFIDGTYFIRVKSIDCMNHSSSFSNIFDTLKEGGSLYILSSGPSGDVATKRPYLDIVTSTLSDCYYSFSGMNYFKKFDYTSGKIHQTSLNLNHSSYSFDIKCNNSFNDESTGSVSFSVKENYFISSVSFNSEKKSYAFGEKVNFNVRVSPTLKRIPYSKFELYENGKKKDIFVINELEDSYQLSFDSPYEEGTRSYVLRVYSSDASFSESSEVILEFNKPSLFLRFIPESNINSIESSDYDNILFSKFDNITFGISGPGNNIEIDPLRFSLSMPLESEAYIFLTSYSFEPSKREDMLYYEGFLNLANPSFGFFLSDDFEYKVKLEIDDIVIENDYAIGKGKERILIKNLGKNILGQRIVYVSRNKVQG